MVIDTNLKQIKLNQELDNIEQSTNEFILYLAERTSVCSDEELKEFKKDKNFYLKARSLIIELHLLTEINIERVIENYFVEETCSLLPLPNFRKDNFRNLILKSIKITFDDKVRILKKIYKPKDKRFFKKIETLNAIRNGFAHGVNIKDKKFNFGVRGNIFLRDNAVLFVREIVGIFDEFDKALEEIKAFREQEKKTSSESNNYEALLKLDSKR